MALAFKSEALALPPKALPLALYLEALLTLRLHYCYITSALLLFAAAAAAAATKCCYQPCEHASLHSSAQLAESRRLLSDQSTHPVRTEKNNNSNWYTHGVSCRLERISGRRLSTDWYFSENRITYLQRERATYWDDNRSTIMVDGYVERRFTNLQIHTRCHHKNTHLTLATVSK